MSFHFHVDIADIQRKLGQVSDVTEQAIKSTVESLSIGAHAHILDTVQKNLEGYKRQAYLGKDNQNVRWAKLGDGMWIVEVDEKARWLEEGREAIFMSWLLKNAKTAKDGCVLNPRNKVLTNNGWKRIKNVKVGDLVLSHSGKFREVKELLVKPTPIGTEFVNFYIAYDTTSHHSENGPSNANEICSPSISLTADHLVLTPSGWVEAGNLKKGDLVASPADLTRRCLWCNSPLPINAHKARFCLNNSCARSYGIKFDGKMLGRLTKEQRSENAKMGNRIAKELGVFNRPDWGSKNPSVLHKMRLGSNEARKKWGKGTEPELFFERLLNDANILHEREVPLHTDRIVNAGNGRTRNTVLFLDFFIKELNLAIEVDGTHWHSSDDQKERDLLKEITLQKKGVFLWRVKAHEIYEKGPKIINDIKLWLKNHSGDLGICYVPIRKIKKGVVASRQHVYANKYDICLDAEEHSFACQTVFIHNSTYKSIPMPLQQGAGKKAGWHPNAPALSALADKVLKDNHINLKKLVRDDQGKPVVGVLNQLDTSSYQKREDTDFWSMPRSPETAAKIGLQPHDGIHKLEGMMVVQFPDPAAKHGVRREAITYRTISSKHEGEGRWEYPKVEALNAIPKAHDWAKEQFEKAIQELEKIYKDIID